MKVCSIQECNCGFLRNFHLYHMVRTSKKNQNKNKTTTTKRNDLNSNNYTWDSQHCPFELRDMSNRVWPGWDSACFI